jgi:phosphoadenosine phosphosulfate reductase
VDAELSQLVDHAVTLLKAHEPASGYYGCFSGGKDSVVLRHVTERAGVNVTWHYNQTTIDPPELIHFMREHYPDVHWVKPTRGHMLVRAAEKRHMPTRRALWCCDEYKERRPPKGETMLMGIRADESVRRRDAWTHTGLHKRTNRKVVLPVLDFDTPDVWEYIHDNSLAVCRLYGEGWHRLGCVGCPRISGPARIKEFARWPKIGAMWRKAAYSVWESRRGTLQRNGKEWFGSALLESADAFWEWWLHSKRLPARTQNRTHERS